MLKSYIFGFLVLAVGKESLPYTGIFALQRDLYTGVFALIFFFSYTRRVFALDWDLCLTLGSLLYTEGLCLTLGVFTIQWSLEFTLHWVICLTLEVLKLHLGYCLTLPYFALLWGLCLKLGVFAKHFTGGLCLTLNLSDFVPP